MTEEKDTDQVSEILKPLRPLNNAQRKALADIVERRVERKTKIARQEEHGLTRRITLTIVKRLKADSIQTRIEVLRKEIESLEKARSELGFYCHRGGELTIRGGQARQMLEEQVHENSLTLRSLEEMRDGLKQAIWLAETTDEARAVVSNVDSF